MLEYVESDSGITQIFSQDDVDEAAFFRRDGCGFFFCSAVSSFAKISLISLLNGSSCSVAAVFPAVLSVR